MLLITRDDRVYGFGPNKYGVLGLGYEGKVKEPTIITELCNNNTDMSKISLRGFKTL